MYNNEFNRQISILKRQLPYVSFQNTKLLPCQLYLGTVVLKLGWYLATSDGAHGLLHIQTLNLI